MGQSTRRPQALGDDTTAPEQGREAVILGIESSCDDTAAAVVSASGRILGEAIAGQADIHAAWGGVVPKLAQKAHAEAIDRVVDEALQNAGLTPPDLDAVAVTIGPGLSMCLRVGVLKARELSARHALPVVPIHHMEAHALVARAVAAAAAAERAVDVAAPADVAVGADEAPPADVATAEFPFLCVLVSGGHNLALLVRGIGDYVQLGTTLDDALGEAYDKVARLLGLELKPSGGAALEAFARNGDPNAFVFGVPMRKHKTCDFSYAGLKNSVRLAIEGETKGDLGPDTEQVRADIAASFQRVAVKHLEERVSRATQWAKEMEPSVTSIVVAGGVAANGAVRAALHEVSEAAGLSLVMPPPRLCTDNGVMVAWAGMERWLAGQPAWVQPPAATEVPEDDEWVDLRPRWPLTEVRHELSQSPARQKSLRQVRLHQSLTDITRAQLAGEELEPAAR